MRFETQSEHVADPMWNQDLTLYALPSMHSLLSLYISILRGFSLGSPYFEGDGTQCSLMVAVYNSQGKTKTKGKSTLIGGVAIDPTQFKVLRWGHMKGHSTILSIE